MPTILSNPNISGSLSIGRIASAPLPIPLWPSPTPIPPSKVGLLNIAPLEYQAHFVIVKAFYPLLLIVSYKFSIHIHLQLYLLRCQPLVGIFYSILFHKKKHRFNSYALRWLRLFSSLIYLGIIIFTIMNYLKFYLY